MKIILLILIAGVLAWLIHERYQPIELFQKIISTTQTSSNNAISIIKAPDGSVTLTNKPKNNGVSTTKERATGQAVTNRRCDGRMYCSQMTSCEEAIWFLRNCPGTKMDGNHDGISCEEQWCK
jgi:hypothetical protein